MTFQQFPYNLKFWQFVALLIGFIAFIFVLTGFISNVFAFGTGWADNFDSYANGSSLNGQGGWTTSTDIKITTDGYYSSPNSIKRNSNEPYATNAGEEVDEGILSFSFYDNSSANGFGIYLTNISGSSNGFVFREYKVGGQMKVYYDNGFTKVYNTGLAYAFWHTAQIEFNSTSRQVRFKIDDLEWSEYFTLLTSGTDAVGGVSPRWGYGSNLFFDSFSIAGLAPPEPAVWVDTPASATEITDLDSTIELNWEGLTGYDDLYLTFTHLGTGIITGALRYSIADIGTEGDMEINLQDFNFTKNGNWYLKAIASYEGYLIEGGMFLSGYGSQFTNDLTDGDYYLDINIEGFTPVFEMSDFGSWYDENVDRFDAPTGVFDSLAGFLSPIFSYIGEFGNRISDYFDNNDAYARGYDVGKAIPVFAYYIGQTAYFLGGFPILSTFLIVVLLMVGIFIFKLVIRFIPHFGS